MKTTPKRLLIISAATVGTCLFLLITALWLYKNYPRFYCPAGTHKSYNMMDGYYCGKDGAPEID